MPFGIGIWEILILLLVVLLVFGPKRLPEMGRSLGKGLREFKDSISGNDHDDDDDDQPVHKRLATELPPAEVETPAPAASSPAASSPAESRERDSVS
jgi:sec-independent protein translocase protein TatA